ncbi:MAG: hypothetical protein Q4C55_10430 [Eubacterium sp.]|nr:hypothetical protein [Eubacterium sp.]
MEAYCEISGIRLSLEHYTGPGHTLEVKLGTGEVLWTDDRLFYQKPKVVKVLSEQERTAFRKLLEDCGVLDWRPRYYDDQKMAGLLWKLEVFFGDEQQNFRGTGVTPESWDEFIEKISVLIGKDLGL